MKPSTFTALRGVGRQAPYNRDGSGKAPGLLISYLGSCGRKPRRGAQSATSNRSKEVYGQRTGQPMRTPWRLATFRPAGRWRPIALMLMRLTLTY